MRHAINIPSEFKVNKNELFVETSEADFIEDILQIEMEAKNLTIDLGWYGEEMTQDGIYKLYLISHSNWDDPIMVIESMSKEEIIGRLDKLISTVSSGEFTI